MQEKKNKRLLLSLIVLLLATAVIFWFGKKDNTYDIDENIFRQADLKAVNEVVLESPSGKIDLKYMGSAWQVNGTYNADRNMIEVLFATLREARPKRPVVASQRDSIGKAMAQHGVKVSLISGGNIVEEFFAAGNDQKTQAYFKATSGDVPYIMTIPGYRVYVSGIFELPASGWRDKYVFGFNWRNFKNLEARFPNHDADNFLVEMDESFFGIKGVETDTAKINNFLDAVSLLTVDEYIEPTPRLDSVTKATAPLLTLTITDIADKKYSLKIFPPDRTGQFLGLVENDWALLHENKIRTILHPKRYFVK
jgi:hypothetical protein